VRGRGRRSGRSPRPLASDRARDETLAAASATESDRAIIMLRYTTMMLEIAIDRLHWPGRIL